MPTSAHTPTRSPLVTLGTQAGWHRIVHSRLRSGDPNANYQLDLGTFPAIHEVFLRGICQGTGKVVIHLKSRMDLPLSCTSPQEQDASIKRDGNPPRNETYQVTLTIQGVVEWDVSVESPT